MKFVVCGNYGADNQGDEMILAGLIKSLRAAIPRCEITALSGKPEQTSLTHNIRSFHMFPCGIRSRLKSLFTPCGGAYKAVKNCDYFVLGGGGLFTNLTFRSYIIWNCQAQKALKMGKKIIMFGQSIGPVEGKLKRKIVRNLFNQSELIVVRDKASLHELRKLGISKKVHIMPDLALRTNIKAAPSRSQKDRKVLVAPRYYKKRVDFKDFIKKHKASVINFHPSDKTLTNKGRAKLSIQEINRAYKDSEIVVGMRLHSIITAVKHRKPFIAINYSPKVRNFVKELDLESQVLEINELDQLEGLYEKTLAKQDKIIKKIDKYLERSKERFKETEELLQSLFQRQNH